MISNLESSWYTRYLGHRGTILEKIDIFCQHVMRGVSFLDPFRMSLEGLHYVVNLNDAEQPVIELDCERTLISEENNLSDSQAIQDQLSAEDRDTSPPTPSYSAAFAQYISAQMTEDYHSYSLMMEHVSHFIPGPRLVQSYTDNSSPDAHPGISAFVMQMHPAYIPFDATIIMPNIAPSENIATMRTPSTPPPIARAIPEPPTPASPDPVAQQNHNPYIHMSFTSIFETFGGTDIFLEAGFEEDLEMLQVPSEPNAEEILSDNEAPINLEFLEAISPVSEDNNSDILSSFTPRTRDYHPTGLESNIISSDQARPIGYENIVRFLNRVRRIHVDSEENTPTESLDSRPKRPLDTEAVELQPSTKKTKRTPPSSPR